MNCRLQILYLLGTTVIIFIVFYLRSGYNNTLSIKFNENTSPKKFSVLLTRQEGHNDSLKNSIISNVKNQCPNAQVSYSIVPSISFEEGLDYSILISILQDFRQYSSVEGAQKWHFDWIVLTSPEAARYFMKALEVAVVSLTRLAKHVRFGCVGDATADVLAPYVNCWVPTHALASYMKRELPLEQNTWNNVLFPASELSYGELKVGLEHRGANVHMLKTYNTIQRIWSERDKGLLDRVVDSCSIVLSVTSPSAMTSTMKNLQKLYGHRFLDLVSCIHVAPIGATTHEKVLQFQKSLPIPFKSILPIVQRPTVENLAQSIASHICSTN